MRCNRCGKDLGNSSRCKFCGYNNEENFSPENPGNVREMTPIEKNFFNGVTIDENQNEDNFRQKSRTHFYIFDSGNTFTFRNSGGGFFSRLLGKLIDGLAKNSLITKIAVGLIVLALGAIVFFVALPILFVLLSIGVALAAYSMIRK